MSSSDLAWVLVLPVKRLAAAKTRLGAPYDTLRRDLALAFALDTAAAALAAGPVRAVLAVTHEPAAAEALAALGVEVVEDEPDAGLNPALRHGFSAAAERHPGCGTGAVSADLPALRPVELAHALGLAAAHRQSFVRDAAGSGTTVVVAAPGVTLQPVFGTDSASRHLDAGHVELVDRDLASLRQDVDTARDVEAAERLGVGQATSRVLRDAGLRT